jgi:dipeptide/tripeptide permease
MAAAALVERRRRDAAASGGGRLSVFWLVPQFLVFGVSEMFTAVGLIEFFYKQACAGMQAFLTALTYCSYAFGFYLSSVLVSLVNRVTFYWMLAALSVLNFFCFLLCARWYNAGVDGSDAAAASGQVAAEGVDGKEII